MSLDYPNASDSAPHEQNRTIGTSGLGLALAMWICNLVTVFGLAVLDASSTFDLSPGAWVGLGISCVLVEICFLAVVLLLSKNS